MLEPKKDKYKVCSLLDKALPNFGSQAAEDRQFCQALRNQNRSKGLVWHYINIDAMGLVKYPGETLLLESKQAFFFEDLCSFYSEV